MDDAKSQRRDTALFLLGAFSLVGGGLALFALLIYTS